MGTDPGWQLKEKHLCCHSFFFHSVTSVGFVSLSQDEIGWCDCFIHGLTYVWPNQLRWIVWIVRIVIRIHFNVSGVPSGSLDTDTRFFTGNEALNGGLVGAGLGALGATILGPAVGGALNNGNFNNGNFCGKRRKRQAENGETRFFLGGASNHCGSCCYNNYNNGQYNNGYNNGQYNNGQYNNGHNNNGHYNNGHNNNGHYNNGNYNN